MTDPEERLDPDDEQAAYAMRPTRLTLFLRTFLPWQLWRFVVINLRMLQMIRASEQAHAREGGGAPR